MRKLIAILLFSTSTMVHAELEHSSTELYSMKKLMTKSTSVNIKVVRDIQKACEAESHRYGLGGFGYTLDACSFWQQINDQHICTIFVPENTNNDALGHEIRHCFQGHFH